MDIEGVKEYLNNFIFVFDYLRKSFEISLRISEIAAECSTQKACFGKVNFILDRSIWVVNAVFHSIFCI
jgi:hypothetical protein